MTVVELIGVSFIVSKRYYVYLVFCEGFLYMLDIGPIHRKEYESGTDRSEPVVIAEAPGRVHYLGEHGEPKAGLFLSSAINRYIRVAVSIRKDSSLRFYAANLGERKRTTLVNLKYKREDRWANYIKVAIHLFAQLGYPAKGLNFTLVGDIPQHIGLASSSAIEVATATALRGFFHAPISDEDLLKRLIASQEVFFGKHITPIDYVIALSAQEDQFLVVDEITLGVTLVKSSICDYKILIMDSRVPRLGVEDELKERRQDIKKGLELLCQKKQGTSLRDFVTEDLIESMGNLPEEIRRRSMHIIQELRRVYDAEEALNKMDIPSLSKVILHSHESLRDLYEVSCPEIDWLVKRAQEIDGVLGSRMTGQGFGGCTYTIIKEDVIEEYRRRLEDYERIFGFHPVIYEVKPAGGSRLVSPESA
jgi:galactokinase